MVPALASCINSSVHFVHVPLLDTSGTYFRRLRYRAVHIIKYSDHTLPNLRVHYMWPYFCVLWCIIVIIIRFYLPSFSPHASWSPTSLSFLLFLANRLVVAMPFVLTWPVVPLTFPRTIPAAAAPSAFPFRMSIARWSITKGLGDSLTHGTHPELQFAFVTQSNFADIAKVSGCQHAPRACRHCVIIVVYFVYLHADPCFHCSFFSTHAK